MDEIATYNRERWNALVEAGIEYARPWLDLTPEAARQRLEFGDQLGDLSGRRVLCLANGGGQQSAAFALLGAAVTVLDLSDAQLEQDRRAAAHYGLHIRIEQGDMRDLARFDTGSFDLVNQNYSINFVPDPATVFAEVARVLRTGGTYVLQFSNPHRFSLRDEVWRDGYALTLPYRDGEVQWADPDWEVASPDGSIARVRGPREFCHTWATLINGLAQHKFVILQAREWMIGNQTAAPGSWAHCTQVLPPYLAFRMVYRPDAFEEEPG